MSDAPMGPGWWQASDGRWYPPQNTPSSTEDTLHRIWVIIGVIVLLALLLVGVNYITHAILHP